MKKLSIITMALFLLSVNSVQAKGFGKKDIVNYCSSKKLPTAGKQFNGISADKMVMNLLAGKYSYPNGGALLLFTNNYYILKLPSNRNGIHGTSTDDLIASGGILGGCSKEQLSEAVSKNKLTAKSFKLLKKYR